MPARQAEAAASPATVPPAGRRPLGRRRRHLRRAAAALAAAALATAGILAWHLHRSRPAVYQPGEDHPEITRTLEKEIPAEAPSPRFTDVTSQAGLEGFRAFAGERSSQLPEDMGSGAAWGDYDDDGDEDLFLVSAGGALGLRPEARAPSLLYENLGDGVFRQSAAFPDTRVVGMGAAWGDYDGDGRLDLVLTGYNALRLYRNDGARLVRDSAFPELAGFWAGAAWGDYDNDRDLDLYVCGYVQYVEGDASAARASQQYGYTVPYTLNPSSYRPERNLLFRNDGAGRFAEVAKELGVDNPQGRSLSALWHDFDDDGRLDLYVANDVSDNALYWNRGGRFEDISHAAWVADYRGAMGLAAADWDRDGDDDLFISHWVAQENALYDSLLVDLRRRGTDPAAQGAPGAAPERDAARQASAPGAGNAPHAAHAGGAPPAAPPASDLRFVDNADPRGLGHIALQFVGWGAEFADFDADGWPDLAVANGSTFETESPPRRLKSQEPFLFWNRRGEYFHNLALRDPILSQPRVGRGLAVSDFDNDGDLDLLLIVRESGALLMRNDMQSGHWIKLRLRRPVGSGGEAAGYGEGSKLVARLDGAELRRSVSGASYLSQSSRVVHFGLGGSPRLDHLEVRWLGGRAQEFENLEADAEWVLTEGEPEPRRAAETGPPRAGASGGLDPGREPALPSRAADEPDRARLAEFWRLQRAAMQAMKVDKDIPAAIALFRQALAINSGHEDSRYYLGNCLAARGDVRGALLELERLARQNPQSHRALKRWGTLRAMFADTAADLEAATQTLERALAVNPEETGALLVLGEVALLSGERELAEQRLSWVCRTNPKAAGGFFLRAYVAWKAGAAARSRALLEEARRALGEDWKPQGASAEGDVLERLHTDATPLSEFWEAWDGSLDPDAAFAALDARLEKMP